ncbi:MAG: prephenate dehydratase [Hormoscilla sp.]
MAVSIAHLGPTGTYSEAAAISVARSLQDLGVETLLCACPSIARAIETAAEGGAQLAVVPVENSLEGTVTITLDTLWQLDKLQIQQAYVLPISHALLSLASKLEEIKTVYSHPQALAQCHGWLKNFLPERQLIPTNSTTEALKYLDSDRQAGAIASRRAAELYQKPVLAYPINDHPDNCTRFLVLSLQASPFFGPTEEDKSHTSIAFSVPANVPGALVKPLQAFASRGINLSRIESRPSKRSLGDYVFFLDLEADAKAPSTQAALAELTAHTEILKIFGSYNIQIFTNDEL